MDRLLSEKAVLDAITEYGDGRNLYMSVGELKRRIEQLPSAEPQTGKWIEDKGQQTLMQNFIERGEVWRVCSVCGAGHMIGHKYAIDKAYHDRHHNFCPNCGVKMEVEHE